MNNIPLPLLVFVVVCIILAIISRFKPELFKYKMFPLEVHPSSSEIRASLVSIILFALILFSAGLEYKPEGIKIPVQETLISTQFYHEDSVRPVISIIDKIEIRGQPYLTNKNPDFGLNILALIADKNFNLIDLTFLLLLSIILAIGLWNFDFKNPFKIKVSRTVYIIAFAFIIYCVTTILSNTVINRAITKMTNGIYKYDSSFSLSFWYKFFIAIILLRLGQIFKNAEKLQQEQDLTV